eukprot:TRINITY_DN5740_c0_g1_i1.p1 TRINITY_DN5740_c0_g1~~TRINITY_DN5740_c0_g1_i1.p1  ORF type:complete len:841 (+),score=125.68 TRINITY_DN5740_c0_g1_i1:55-2577(+)
MEDKNTVIPSQGGGGGTRTMEEMMQVDSLPPNEDMFMRLLELKAKYSAALSVQPTTPPPAASAPAAAPLPPASPSSPLEGAGVSVSLLDEQQTQQSLSVRPTKRRKVGIDQDQLHHYVESIFRLHRGVVHVDVLAAALQPNWAKLTSDDSSSSSSSSSSTHLTPLSEIRSKVRQHLQSYRVQESGPLYTPASHSDPHLWSLNGSTESALEDKDGVLLLPATSSGSTEYLAAAVLSALGSTSDLSDLAKNITSLDTAVLEEKVRDWLMSHGWAQLRNGSPASFDYQIRCILHHHPGVDKFLPLIASSAAEEDVAEDGPNAADADEEDSPSDDGTSPSNAGSAAVSTSAAPAARRPRNSRRGGGSGRHSSSPSPSQYGNGSYPAGSAVQAAKQRRLHQMHQLHHRAPPTHRQRARAHKHRVSHASHSKSTPNFQDAPVSTNLAPTNIVTVSAGVLGLHLSNAATGAVTSGATKIPEGAACSQCGASIPTEVWYRGPTLSDWQCGSCGENWSREHSCPVCGLVYDEEDDGDDLPLPLDLYKSLHIPPGDGSASLLIPNQLSASSDSMLAGEQSSWIACDICGRWVMTKCDGITDLSLYDDDNPNHLPYHCPLCRGARKSIPRVFFTRQTAPLFATLLLSAPPPPARDSVDESLKSPRPPAPVEPPAKKRHSTSKSTNSTKDAEPEPLASAAPLSPSESSRPVGLPTMPVAEASGKKNDPLVRLLRAERHLLEAWQHRRAQLDETTDARMTKPKMDQIKLLERRFIEDVSTVRDTLSKSLGSLLERNKNDYELQIARLKKEKDALDQLAESEVARELESYFMFKSQQLNEASEQVLNFATPHQE